MTLRASDYWNPFAVFLRPTQTVTDAFEVPKIGIAAALVALPIVLGFVFSIVLGVSVNWISSGIQLVSEWLVWLVGAGILLGLARVLGKGEHAHFNSMATGLSLLRVFQTGLVTLFFLMALLFPSAVTATKQFNEGVLTASEAVQSLHQTTQNATTLQVALGAVILIIAAIIMLVTIYSFYRIMEQSFQRTAFWHIVFGIVFLIILAAINYGATILTG